MSASDLGKVSVLYVEDDPSIRGEVADILNDTCADLFVATDGKEGLKLFKERRPDIVLSDIRMPKMDGLAMSQAIVSIDPQTPIIVSSAFNDSEYLLNAIELGIHRYLIKPIKLNDLFEQLEKAAKMVVQAKTLKQNEELLSQYKVAVDKSALVSKADLEGVITYVNDAFCKSSGYSREELIGSPHNIVRHPDSSDALFKKLWKTIKAKKEWYGVIKNRAKDGSNYIVETTIIPVLNDHAEIEEYISIRRDVTKSELDKQKLEDKLQSSAKTLDEKVQFIYEYEKALKQSTLFCRTTRSGEITMASNAFIKLLGLDESSVVGTSYYNYVDGMYIRKLEKEIHAAIASHCLWQGMVKHRDSHGSELYLESSFIPIMDTNSEVDEIFCFYADVTKQIHLNRDIIATQREVISTMGAIGETRSRETGDHVKRVAEYSKHLALKYGLSDKEAEEIKMASPMHDIGKVGIPDNILNKPGSLTEDEFEVMKTHATLGYEMLKGSHQALLETASIISLSHHEKWDGSGYPNALKGEDIHIYGRITAIADVFDALGHDRVYKKAWPLENILDLFKKERGRHFDPHLIDIFLDYLDEFLVIKEQFDGKSEHING